MRNRKHSPFYAVLSLLLIASVPTQAGTVPFTEVVSVVGGAQGVNQTVDLRLRSVQQSGGAQQSVARGDAAKPGDPANLTATVTTAPGDPQQANVETIEQGDVAGTVCDCGEITIPGGGFPKWPFLALVPLVCVTGVCTNDNPVCVGAQCNPPPCTGPECNPPEIPEPGSLLLLGTGLTLFGAGMRRRYARLKVAKQLAVPTEV